MQKQVFEVFVLPATFKTVSFHHRAHYSLRIFSQENLQIEAVQVVHQFKAPAKMEIEERSGNIFGIGGSIQNNQYWSERFPIDYNDQSAKFSSGVWFRARGEQKSELVIGIELYRTDLQIKKQNTILKVDQPVSVKVSQQVLYLSLRQNIEIQRTFNFRKLIFPSNEYISFIDLCAIVTRIGCQIDQQNLQKRRQNFLAGENGLDCCCIVAKKPTDPERLLRDIYHLAIEQKLQAYFYLSNILKQKIKQYLWLRKQRNHALNTNEEFEKLFVRRKISDLSYVRVKCQLQDEQRLESNLPILKGKTFTDLLCQHYESDLSQLESHILQESVLIEHNIRALFQRVIHICFAMREGLALQVSLHQKKRVKQFMFAGDFPFPNELQRGLSREIIVTHSKKVDILLAKLQNFTYLQQRQPLLLVSQEQKQVQMKCKPLDIARTVTILVHGFRGNQYDLSKMKSYLNLFLGFNHFYAIKSIAGSQMSNARISKLAQSAGEELNRYLDMHTGIKTVNVIGFSMGGLIARAMMKHLLPHKDKFNLLLTLASPHLGLKELDSCLVRTGLLYMRRVAKIESIQDLNMQRDNENSRFLMDLASCDSINYFKSVVLVGSKQDEYVPMYSSLCDYQGDNEHIKQLNKRLNQQRKDIVRCLARVECEESIWDKLTMRKAHINMLEDDSFIRLLIVKLQKFFTSST